MWANRKVEVMGSLERDRPDPCAAVLETIHYVIKGERVLKRAGLAIDVIPVPRRISPDCGMALAFPCDEQERVERLLAEQGIRVTGIYRLHKDRYSRLSGQIHRRGERAHG